MQRLVLSAAVLLGSAAAAAEPPRYGLKGYEVGAEMADCPQNAAKREVRPDGSIACGMQDDLTLAGEPINFLLVLLYEGRVVSIVASLPNRGSTVGAPIVDALKEKYGRPSMSKPHVNSYTWQSGSHVIKFDGYQALVIAADSNMTSTIRARAASKNKSDL